jgi:2-oxoglutarate ferredoxin oxidoreductase subunit beta
MIPHGNIEKPLDGCKVAVAAGATMVSRWSTAQRKQLIRTFKNVLNHKGFSFIEVMSQCPVQTGRYILGFGSPQFNFQWLKDNCVTIDDLFKSGEVEAPGKIPVGDFLQIEKPEFKEEVQRMNQRVKEAQAKGGHH